MQKETRKRESNFKDFYFVAKKSRTSKDPSSSIPHATRTHLHISNIDSEKLPHARTRPEAYRDGTPNCSMKARRVLDLELDIAGSLERELDDGKKTWV